MDKGYPTYGGTQQFRQCHVLTSTKYRDEIEARFNLIPSDHLLLETCPNTLSPPLIGPRLHFLNIQYCNIYLILSIQSNLFN